MYVPFRIPVVCGAKGIAYYCNLTVCVAYHRLTYKLKYTYVPTLTRELVWWHGRKRGRGAVTL
jgi:hypothetical protein